MRQSKSRLFSQFAHICDCASVCSQLPRVAPSAFPRGAMVELGALEAAVAAPAGAGSAEVPKPDALEAAVVAPGGAHSAEASEETPDWLTPECEAARCLVFLVTFAAVLAKTALHAAEPLVTLEGWTREGIRDALLDAAAHPQDDGARGGRPRTQPIVVGKMAVFLEEPRHFHVAIKFASTQRFLPLKLALRRRKGLASHWSTSHTQWWSALRYGAIATEHKPQVDLSPLTWPPELEMNVFEESQEPWNARLFKRRREEREAQGKEEPKKKEKKEKFGRLDFNALVVAEGLTTPSAAMRHVQDKGSVAMQAFVATHQKRLPELLREAHEWGHAREDAAAEEETDWALLQRLARGACSCSEGPCQWLAAAEAFFARNRGCLDEERLAACVAMVVKEGPSKTARVPLLTGPTNSGKSTVFDSLDDVFGHAAVMHTPALGASMPLATLATQRKRFLYWDEFQPVAFAGLPEKAPTIPALTFMKLFAGQRLEVQVSQSFHDGNADVQWKRGVVFTAKSEGLWDCVGKATAEDVRHMQSRVEVFEARAVLRTEELRRTPTCKNSFGKWLVEKSAAYAARSLPLAPGPAADQEDGAHAGLIFL